MDIRNLAGVPDGASAFFVSAENAVAFMGGDSMKLNFGNPTQLLMTFTTSMVAAIGTAAGATIWQSFGKPRVEKIAEENSKPKRKNRIYD